MSKRNQKGAQRHAEGQHGSKTHAALIDQLEAGPGGERVVDEVEQKREEAANEGKRWPRRR